MKLGRPVERPQMGVCVVCHKEFPQRYAGGKLVKTCSHKCREELRRIVPYKLAEEKRNAKITVTCMKCGKPFKSPSKFIRRCKTCKDTLHDFPNYSDVWGSPI